MRIEKPLNEEQQTTLVASFTDEETKAIVAEACRRRAGKPGVIPTRPQSPSQRGEVFEVPVLAVKQGDFFRQFEAEPFAAASLGQVHRAITLQGDPVAVKIQYPAIQKAVQNDFKLLRSATMVGRVTGHVPKTLVDELESCILKETDYLQEGKNLELFRESLRPLAYLEIPRVYWDLTKDRVLTMSYVHGVSLTPWLAAHPSQGLRNLLGARLYELFFYQVFRVRALHADPHPGNYLFTPEGNIRLVDFGCVKEVTPQITEIFHYFLDESFRPTHERVDRFLQMLWGPEVSRKSPQARKLMAAMMEYSQTIFPVAGRRETLVDFGSPQVLTGMVRLAEEVLRGKLMVPDLIFYKRAEVGLYNYLHQLGAQVDVAAILRRVRTSPDEPAARR